MTTPTIPAKLSPGDEVRVIAPARSRALVMEHDNTEWINRRFADFDLRLSFGDHVDEDDVFRSSSIESRVADLHAAFADPEVKAILTVIGGFNSNELLPYLDWDLIATNPKILCGYSDITALSNALLAKANLVSYSGPHWSSFGMRDHFEPTGEWFRNTLMSDQPLPLTPAHSWSDDLWFLDQDQRQTFPNEGWWSLRTGVAVGRIVGGNLCTLNLLQGTEFMPSLDGALVFCEDDYLTNPVDFARNLTSLLQLPDSEGIRGLVIGRFQRSSEISREVLDEIIRRQPVLRDVPVVANLDFGHTSPLLTIPIGGEATISIEPDTSAVTITRH